MADQEQVQKETQDPNVVTEPLMVTGHRADGEFAIMTTVNAFVALAALEHARARLLSQINPNKPRKVIPIHGGITPLAQANGRH
jgi:hypothetical protein